jgi:hypothetical protein
MVAFLGFYHLCRWEDGCRGSSEGVYLERGVRIMRRRTPEERYTYNIRKQKKTLEEFAEQEIEWAEHLILWYRINKQDMPDDEYRACVFFMNKEFLRKPGSLTLLYEMFLRCIRELPEVTKEIAFDILAFRFRMYAEVLKKGGYDGPTDWK